MINLLLPLFVSAVFAVQQDSCDGLLRNAYIEMEAARSENRARLIRGEISQAEFERMQAELDKRKQFLNFEGYESIGSSSGTKADKKAREIMQSVEMQPVFNFELESKDNLLSFGFEPVAQLGLLRVSSRGESLYYFSNADTVTPHPIIMSDEMKSKRYKVFFLNKDKNKVMFSGADHFYIVDQNASDTLASPRYESKYQYQLHRISPQGNFLHPNVGATESGLIRVLNAYPPYEWRTLVDVGEWFNYDMLGVSQDERYLSFRSYDKVNLYNLKTGGPGILIPNRAKDLVVTSFSLSSDSKYLYIVDNENNLSTVSVKEIESCSSDDEMQELILNSETYKVSEWFNVSESFSNDGRFLVIAGWPLKQNVGDHEKYRLKIWDTLLKEEVYQGPFLNYLKRTPNVSISNDSKHIYFSDTRGVKVFKLNITKEEVLK